MHNREFGLMRDPSKHRVEASYPITNSGHDYCEKNMGDFKVITRCYHDEEEDDDKLK